MQPNFRYDYHYYHILSSPPSILPLTIHHRRQRTDKRRYNRRRNNPRRIYAPILLPVRNHIHRYQLQRRNIQYQKRTHLIAGNSSCLSNCCFTFTQILRIPSLRLQFRQLLHGLQPRWRASPAQSQDISWCQDRTKLFYNFY